MSNILLLAVLLIPLFLVLLIVFWAAKNGIGPSPTTGKQKRAIFAALPPKVDGNIFELGSGWGGLAIALARHYPKCVVIGIENSPIPFLISWIRAKLSGAANLEFRRNDIQKEPLDSAALIVCYLHTGAMRRLKPKLERELSGKTWIVSNTFSFHGWNAVSTVNIKDIYHSKVFVYYR